MIKLNCFLGKKSKKDDYMNNTDDSVHENTEVLDEPNFADIDNNGDTDDDDKNDDQTDGRKRHGSIMRRRKVTGRIKTNGVGSEIITFRVPLGALGTLLCIVNVPDELKDVAPVYVNLIDD